MRHAAAFIGGVLALLAAVGFIAFETLRGPADPPTVIRRFDPVSAPVDAARDFLVEQEFRNIEPARTVCGRPIEVNYDAQRAAGPAILRMNCTSPGKGFGPSTAPGADGWKRALHRCLQPRALSGERFRVRVRLYYLCRGDEIEVVSPWSKAIEGLP